MDQVLLKFLIWTEENLSGIYLEQLVQLLLENILNLLLQ